MKVYQLHILFLNVNYQIQTDLLNKNICRHRTVVCFTIFGLSENLDKTLVVTNIEVA